MYFFLLCAALSSTFEVRPLAPMPMARKSHCLKGRFAGTVLVVVYNYALYSSAPLLRSLYADAFPTIMLCGPETSDTFLIQAVIAKKGFLFYKCMEHAINRHPDANGYLLIADDMVLNYWNLVPLDTNKLWEGPRLPINPPLGDWHWWRSPYGRRQCELALAEIMENTANRTAQEYTENLIENGNNTSMPCHRGRSDIFYVPRRFAGAFRALSAVMHKHQVFVEIAVPTIFRMLDRKANFEAINGIYIPSPNAKYFWKLYNKSLTFLHPFKLNADQRSAHFNKEQLTSRVLAQSRNLTRCRGEWREPALPYPWVES